MKMQDNSVGNTEMAYKADNRRAADNKADSKQAAGHTVDNTEAGNSVDMNRNHPEHVRQSILLAVLKVIFSFWSLFNECVVAMNLS
jgi:hypothetical protein